MAADSPKAEECGGRADRQQRDRMVTRRKGEVTARMHEREAPHLVEMALPNGGFGLILIEAIYTFHRASWLAAKSP